MANIEKIGVGWNRTFKNGKEGLKISINREIYIMYKNTAKKVNQDPDYVIVKFVDEEENKK